MTRPRPCDPRVESAVLGALLIDPSRLPVVSAILRPEDMGDPARAEIYRAMLLVDLAGQELSVPTVSSQLRAMPIGHPDDERTVPRLNTVGGAQAIDDLIASVSSAAMVEQHARLVAEDAARRRAMDVAEKVLVRASESAPLATLSSLSVSLADAVAGVVASESESLGDVLDVLGDSLADPTVDTPPTSTGLHALDKPFAGGWREGELIIVAARPGVGKTALALRTTLHAARGGAAVFVSLEMPKAQLASRVLSAESGVALHRIRARTLDAKDMTAISAANLRLRKLPLYLHDLKSLAAGRGQRPTLAALRAMALRERARRGRLSLLVVDYLQLVRSDRDRDMREQEVSEVARGLKELSLEVGAPVVALAQLNRAIERRGEDAEPELSDLRESGEIEQAADAVIFLGRPKTPAGVMRVYVKKNRNGPTATVDLRWAPDTARPGDLTDEYEGNVTPIRRAQ